MEKIILIVGMAFLSNVLLAQNVGIGTNTPTSTLEVKKPIKSIVKISSNGFDDSTQLILSNRNTGNLGTDMQLTSIRETGIRISSSSDLTGFNNDTIMQITPTGLVGIRTVTPQYPLDVNGDVNVRGEIRANGTSGENGQFLQSNGNGTMSWVDKERFKNFRVFRNEGTLSTTVTSTFNIPTGVTEVAVEIWGGGSPATPGTGASEGISGGSGGYLYAVIPVGSFTSLTTKVAAGGFCQVCGNLVGINSTVTLPAGALTLTVESGLPGVSFIDTRGGYRASGSYLPNISFMGIEGQTGKSSEISYENSPSGYFVFNRNADGGDAPLRPGSGGRSGWKRTNWDGSAPLLSRSYNGSEPGGGGGFPNGIGGGGLIIVYW